MFIEQHIQFKKVDDYIAFDQMFYKYMPYENNHNKQDRYYYEHMKYCLDTLFCVVQISEKDKYVRTLCMIEQKSKVHNLIEFDRLKDFYRSDFFNKKVLPIISNKEKRYVKIV